MTAPRLRTPNTVTRTVRARVEHRCHAGLSDDCARVIRPGQDYLRAVAFPGADAYDAPRGSRPWVLVQCEPCATVYGQPMPPRKGEPAPTRAPLVVTASPRSEYL